MNSKFGKKIGTGVIVLLITVWLIPATAGAFTPGEGRQHRGFDMKGHHPPALGIWHNPELVQELGLTTEQVKQLKDADFASREKQLALKAQLDGLRLQMAKAFSEDIVDDTAVLSLAEKISDVRGKLFVQQIESRLTLGKILNADQVKKLKLHNIHLRREGPRDGRKPLYGHRSVEKTGNRDCLGN